MVKVSKMQKQRVIEEYVYAGYSANRIQKELRAKGLGVRRKTLLAEIRNIKHTKVSAEKQKKSVPKKYRKKEKPTITERFVTAEIKPIYRLSMIIPSLPFHSKPFSRNYLGFRLVAFSFDKDLLNQNRHHFRLMLVEKTGNYIDSLSYAQEQVIRVETPNFIALGNAEYLNGKWFFAVEQEGKEVSSESGYI